MIPPTTKAAKNSAARVPAKPPVECSDEYAKLLPHPVKAQRLGDERRRRTELGKRRPAAGDLEPRREAGVPADRDTGLDRSGRCLRGITCVDPAGATRNTALGTERTARKLRDALPGGDTDLRAAVWEFMRPMLSRALVALNRDAFIGDEHNETTVDLHAHPSPSDLDGLDLDDQQITQAA